MKTNIHSIHFNATEKLQEYIKDRIQKLDMYYDKIIGADVFLKLDKSASQENKIAEVKLKIPGNDLFAKKQCATFEEAADQVTEALSKQLIKRKQKSEERKRS